MKADVEMIDPDDDFNVPSSHLIGKQDLQIEAPAERPSSSSNGSTNTSSLSDIPASRSTSKLAPAHTRDSSSTPRESRGDTIRKDVSVPRGSLTSNYKIETKPKPMQATSISTTGGLSGTLVNNDEGDNRFGPSGGRYGLNEKAACNICGSANHFTHACDNAEARAASLGCCKRCNKPGHTYGNCAEPRCLDCGTIGHSSSACTVPPSQRLSAESKAEVERQEIEFGRNRDKIRAKRAEKQLAEHEVTIPKIRTTDSVGTVNGKADAKRKREDQAPPDAPKGPKSARVSEANIL